MSGSPDAGVDGTGAPHPAGRRREFAAVALASVLPVAGIGLFGWSFTSIFVLYWLDLVVLLLVYGGCSLFARRPTVVEGREMRLAWVGERGDDATAPSTAIRPVDRLPPVHTRNVRLLVPNLVLGVSLLLAAGGAVVNFLQGHPPGSLRWLSELSSLTTSAVVGVAAMAGSHCLDAYWGYFRPRRYEQLSAHMVLEIPIRPILLLFAASAVGYVGVLLAAAAVGAVVGDAAAYRTLVTLGVGGFTMVKLVVDWGRFRAERADDPGGLAAWFTPEDPRESA